MINQLCTFNSSRCLLLQFANNTMNTLYFDKTYNILIHDNAISRIICDNYTFGSDQSGYFVVQPFPEQNKNLVYLVKSHVF